MNRNTETYFQEPNVVAQSDGGRLCGGRTMGFENRHLRNRSPFTLLLLTFTYSRAENVENNVHTNKWKPEVNCKETGFSNGQFHN